MQADELGVMGAEAGAGRRRHEIGLRSGWLSDHPLTAGQVGRTCRTEVKA